MVSRDGCSGSAWNGGEQGAFLCRRHHSAARLSNIPVQGDHTLEFVVPSTWNGCLPSLKSCAAVIVAVTLRSPTN